jgi:hypothetical protein
MKQGKNNMIMENKNYVSPEMEVVFIEVEQSIMSVSTERLGTYNEDQEW